MQYVLIVNLQFRNKLLVVVQCVSNVFKISEQVKGRNNAQCQLIHLDVTHKVKTLCTVVRFEFLIYNRVCLRFSGYKYDMLPCSVMFSHIIPPTSGLFQ